MISAATGAVALVVAPVVASHGVDYLIATVILAGLLQILVFATAYQQTRLIRLACYC